MEALSDLKVLEWAQSISGPHCAKRLADLGAEVIKVEEPGLGDEARRRGPFPGDVPHPERSGLFLFLNANKLGVTLNLEHPRGRRSFRDLIQQVDILIENNPPHLVKQLGLEYDRLREVNPRLIMTSITPFGQSGPYQDYRASDLVSFHISGMGHETPQHGVDSLDREPLRAGGEQAHFLVGMVGALATMAAVFARKASGKGQHVDVSEMEALISVMIRINLHRYTYEKEVPSRLASTVRPLNYVPCRDGYVNILLNEPHWWRNLVQAMGNPDWASDPLFQNADFRAQGWDAVQPLLEDWASQYDKEEIFRKLQESHVPCLPGNTFAGLLASEHLEARGFFVELEHPQAGRLRYPGAPYRLSQTPWKLQRPAPLLGEHNQEIYCGRLGYSREDLVRLRGMGVL